MVRLKRWSMANGAGYSSILGLALGCAWLAGCEQAAERPQRLAGKPAETESAPEAKASAPKADEAPKSDTAKSDAVRKSDSMSTAQAPAAAEGSAKSGEGLADSAGGKTAPPASAPATPLQPVSESAALMKTPLIPRDVLLGNPDKAAARISPDGKRLSYLAPVEGVLNVWVGAADKPEEAAPVTHDTYRGIRSYFWAYTNNHILYEQDKNGDEDFHVHAVDLASGDIKDLSPLEKVRAEINGVSERFPDELLVGLNDRDPQYHDIYRVNILTGERKLVQENPDFAGFLSDDDFRIRFASKMTPDGGSTYFQPDGDGGWKEFMKIPFTDSLTTAPAGFDKSGDVLYLLDSRDRNTTALAKYDLKTGKETVIAENAKADVGGVITHPIEKTVEAVSFDYLRTEWDVLDSSIQPDMDYLKTVADGEIQVTSQTLDNNTWTVAYLMDDGPVRFYLYDRQKRHATFLFTNRKSLEGQPLVKMHPLEIKSRDGLTLVCYLSLPPESDPDGDGVPERPVPLVLDVHGGPTARDSWGLDSNAQLLANRGYAVMAVNYRGSTGFGKEFLNAGIKQWARKMHDDLIDAVDWAIEQKIADPNKVAITGGSYGGYATLVGLTMTPERFACGVDIVGPSNLDDATQYNSALLGAGDADVQGSRGRCDAPRKAEHCLEERSPLNFVDRIQRPLLDRPGRQRSARQAGRGRSDRGGDAEEADSGHLCAVSRRGPRLCSTGKQSGVYRGDAKRFWRHILADVSSRSATRSTARRSPLRPAPTMCPASPPRSRTTSRRLFKPRASSQTNPNRMNPNRMNPNRKGPNQTSPNRKAARSPRAATNSSRRQDFSVLSAPPRELSPGGAFRRGPSVAARRDSALHPVGQPLDAQEAFGVGLVVAAAAFHARDAFVIEAVRTRAAIEHQIALIEIDLRFTGHGPLRLANESQERVHLGRIPKTVVHHFGHLGRHPIAQVHEIAIERELLDRGMGEIEERHARRFVHAAAFHAHEAIFHHVDPAHSIAPRDRVGFVHYSQRTEPLAIDADRHAGFEADLALLDAVGRLPRRNRHAKLDQLDAVDHQVFELAGFVADVQAVFVGAIRLG